MQRPLWREMAAEFLGTFVLIIFGCAAVAQVLLSGRTSGEYLSINLGWAFGVTMGVYVAGGISGRISTPRSPSPWPCSAASPGPRWRLTASPNWPGPSWPPP